MQEDEKEFLLTEAVQDRIDESLYRRMELNKTLEYVLEPIVERLEELQRLCDEYV